MTSFPSLLSVRSARMYDSQIQEMMELVHSFNALSFTAGEPSADLLPQKRIEDAFSKAFECGENILGYYHDTAGHVELREWIASWMKADGLMPADLDWRDILLTVGSQEGLSLFTEAVIDPGDIVVTEDPSYPEAFLAFEKEGAVLRTIPMDKEGPSAEALKLLAEKGGVKFFYTIPCYQNPSGKVTSLDRRKEILDLAKKFNFLILEDDPYRHLWFDKMPPSSYLSLSENDGRVIYLGSFSKIVAPGIRCGWMAAPEWMRTTLAHLRVAQSINLPSLMHLALLRFIQDNDFAAHIASLRDVYRTRRNGLVQALEEHIPGGGFRFEMPAGGFFLWGMIPGLGNASDFARFAVREEGVGVIAGEVFSVSSDPALKNTVRLSFAKVSPEESDEGCARLARAISKYVKRA